VSNPMGTDYRRDLGAFVRDVLGEQFKLEHWQQQFFEAFDRGRRLALKGGRMRSDGWLKRATDALRQLEAEAAEELEAYRARALEGGIDWARGPDRTVFRCGCGQSFESLEGLANHAIRGHRWPPEDLLE